MSDKRASLEVIAPTVEEAIAKGLDDLGLTQDAVDVEVLDPGSRGLFGLGSRHARIRLTIKAEPELGPQAVQRAAEPQAHALVEAVEPEPEPIVSAVEVIRAEKPGTAAIPIGEPEPEEDDNTLRVARETVIELLEKMKVRARVSSHYGDPDEAHGKAAVLVDVQGDDLSILIGPKAETLNALQYIASLIVSKELGHAIPLVVDVQGFRARREQQIRQLARRMAEQAVKTGRRQVLEPMPANERRLVHIELRANQQVTTESIGEEPRRKVTIVPKAGG